MENLAGRSLVCFFASLLGAAVFLFGCGSGNQPEASRAGPGGDVSPVRVSRGSLIAAAQKDIDSPQMTQVRSLLPEGTRVKAGDLLCQLVMADKEDDLGKSRADLEIQRVAFRKALALAPLQEKIAAAKSSIALIDFRTKSEELDRAEEGREWLKIVEEETNRKVQDTETSFLRFKKSAQGRLEKQGFIAKVDFLETSRSLGVLEHEASFSAVLLPWMKKRVDEKDVFAARLAFVQASMALDLARFEEHLSDEVASAEVNAKRLDVGETASRVAQLERDIASASILSPVPGIVVRQRAFNGSAWEKIAEGDRVFPGMPFLSVIDIDRYGVEFTVDQRDQAAFKVGQSILFRPDAIPERLFKGIATECGVVALEVESALSEGERGVSVKALLDNGFSDVRVGYSGTVEWGFPETASAASATEGPETGKRIVLAKRPMKRSVTLPGDIQARDRSLVACRFTGKLAFLQDDGNKVKKGDVIARLDTSEPEKALGDLEIQVSNKIEQLQMLEEKSKVEQAKYQRKVLISEGACEVARLSHEMLLNRRNENEIIRLQKNREVIEAKLGLLRETVKLEEDLKRRGLKSEVDILASRLEIIREEREKEVNDYKLDLEVSGPTKRQVRLSKLALEKAELEIEQARLDAENASFTAFFEEAALRAEIAKLQLDKEEKQRRLTESEIKSAQDGIVVLPEVWKMGEYSKFKIGDQVQRQIPFMNVADLESLQVKLDVPEMDIRFVKPGMKVKLTVKSAPGKVFDGWVRNIGLIATTEISKRQDATVEVFLSLKPPDGTSRPIDPAFRPGGTCEVTLDLYSEPEALVVPYHAVLPTHGGPGVFEAGGVFRTFELAFSDGLNGFVASAGLEAGMEILVPGGSR